MYRRVKEPGRCLERDAGWEEQEGLRADVLGLPAWTTVKAVPGHLVGA